MPEKDPKNPAVAIKGQEGRTFDKDGRDLGDLAYHRDGFVLDKDEAGMLDALEESLILQQESAAEADPTKAKAAYQRLMQRYPKHARVTMWKSKIV